MKDNMIQKTVKQKLVNALQQCLATQFRLDHSNKFAMAYLQAGLKFYEENQTRIP